MTREPIRVVVWRNIREATAAAKPPRSLDAAALLAILDALGGPAYVADAGRIDREMRRRG